MRIARRVLLELVFAAAAALVACATLGSWRAWRRNSLALGYWSEKSDLDLTLFSPRSGPLPSVVNRLWRIFRRSGEWAAYAASDAAWAPYANPFELARDPLTAAAFGVRRPPTRAEALVFWMRMREGDAHLSGEKPDSRRRKWDFHRVTVERETGLQSRHPFPGFVDEIESALLPTPTDRDAPYLRPHRWLGSALEARKPIDAAFAALDPALLQIAEAQVHWEIWGLLGQVRLRRNPEEVLRHLENLSRLFEARHPVRQTVADFRKYVETHVERISVLPNRLASTPEID